MAKQVKVEGRLISVPDDATPDEIDQIANPRGNPNVNPSDSIPKAKAPIPTELQGPAPSYFKRVMTNLPYSVANAAIQATPIGLAQTGYEGLKKAIVDSKKPTPSFNDAMTDTVNQVKNVGQSFARPFIHPVDAFEDDPVGTAAAWYGGAKGLKEAPIAQTVKGAGQGAYNAATNLDHGVFSRSGAGYVAGRLFGHPEVGAAIGAGLPIIKGAFNGAREALSSNEVSPFDLRAPRAMPSSGGARFSPKDTGIAGGNVDQSYKAPLPVAEENNFGKYKEVTPRNHGGVAVEPHPTNIEGGVAPAKQLELGIKNPFEIKHERSMPSSGGYNPGIDKVREVGRGPSNPATVLAGEAETRPVQPASVASAQVPETPANAPASFSSSRAIKHVIYDENNNPVAYDDPNNPYNGPGKVREVNSPSNAYSDDGEGMKPGTEAPDRNLPQEEARTPKPLPTAADLHEQRTDQYRPQDVHDEIAMEGLQKRAADSRAKYEDVYQNVIKGQYTPEELRNMTPELQTQIDMKIKKMKHLTTGKSKYGTGLNPAVTESLASRLESENQ